MTLTSEQAAQSFLPGHPDLPHGAGVGARVGSDDFVEALGRVVFRAYVPDQTLLDGTYHFPDVIRAR